MPPSPDAAPPAALPSIVRPAREGGRIALFTESHKGLAGELLEALAVRGVEGVPVSLQDCAIDTTRPWGLDIPGFDGGLPDGGLVRSVKTGSFEQVTLRLGVLHALREAGVPVWNDARAIESCVDKAMTSHLITRAGLRTPATFTAQSLAAARAIAARECAGGAALVFKPLFGAQGIGLRLIRSPDDLPDEEQAAGVYYLQRFIEPADGVWRDYRLFVCGGRVVAAMARVGLSWITNIRQGAAAQPAALTPDLEAAALGAAAATGAGYAGVDLIRDRSGCLNVLEVNSMPAWRGLQDVNPDISVAQRIVDGFLEHVANSRRLSALTGASRQAL